MSSKLLLPELPLMVLPHLAVKIGLNEAIFLQQLHFWLTPTPKYKPHYRIWEGETRPWIYNTYDEKLTSEEDDTTGWKSNFPFWSVATIKRTVKSLKDQNLIITTDSLNASTANRTLWYTINYDEVEKLENSETVERIKLTSPSYQNDTLREYQNDTLMTETTTQITTEIKSLGQNFSNLTQEKPDYLETVVSAIGKTSEQTGDNPNDQYFIYRDKFLDTYRELTGNYPNRVEKEAIIELVQGDNADPKRWELSIRNCVLNWTGRGSPPVARMIEVYRLNGDYQEWKHREYGNDGPDKKGYVDGVRPPDNLGKPINDKYGGYYVG